MRVKLFDFHEIAYILVCGVIFADTVRYLSSPTKFCFFFILFLLSFNVFLLALVGQVIFILSPFCSARMTVVKNSPSH